MSTQPGLYGSPISIAQPAQSRGWQDVPFEDQTEPDLSLEFRNLHGVNNMSNRTLDMWGTSGTSFAAPLLLGALKNFDMSVLHLSERGDLSAVILEGQVQELRHYYALLSDDAHIGAAFQDVPALFSLLKSAVEPLRSTFGDERLFQLEALESDEGTILRVIAKLPHDIGNAAELMSKFNRDWWVDNCARSKASLVFDYETGDGF